MALTEWNEIDFPQFILRVNLNYLYLSQWFLNRMFLPFIEFLDTFRNFYSRIHFSQWKIWKYYQISNILLVVQIVFVWLPFLILHLVSNPPIYFIYLRLSRHYKYCKLTLLENVELCFPTIWYRVSFSIHNIYFN